MNAAYRKLEILEKDFKYKEELVKKDACYMTYVDTDLQDRVNHLLNKIRNYTVI